MESSKLKLGLVFGTTTGNTEDAAQAIRAELADHIDECLDVDSVALERLTEYDVLLIGIPTWDVGGLQDSWDYQVKRLKRLSFAGTRVAFFGQGDQCGYPENFQDAMGLLRELFLELGAIADVGHWPTEDYEFLESKGTIRSAGAGERLFVGLALDEDSQSELTAERVRRWCEQLSRELGLAGPASRGALPGAEAAAGGEAERSAGEPARAPAQ